MTSNDLICNGGINPYHTPISTDIITVPAGATLTAEWHHTLDGADPSDPADPIDPSHKGPVISYLAKVNNATQTDVTGLQWFKIYEDGYTASDAQWAVDRLIANKGKVTFTVPSCIEPGQYLLRHEIIGKAFLPRIMQSSLMLIAHRKPCMPQAHTQGPSSTFVLPSSSHRAHR